MRGLLLATTIAACPIIANAQNIASFAASNCPGQTFYTNFQSGLSQWSFGGGGSLSDGNNAFASYQGPTKNQTTQISADGLTMSILPMPAPNGAGWQAPLLNTQNSFKQTYGYYEIAVNLPASMLQPGATWAFWLIGYQWPPEIDIAEFSTPNGNWFDSAQHSATTPYNAPVYRYNVQPGEYVYAVDWEPDKITWYINGQQTQQSDTPADFHQPMYIVLGSAATSNISAPASMQVLYVRAFKDMQSAIACVPHSGPRVASSPATQPQSISDTLPNVAQAPSQNSSSASFPDLTTSTPPTQAFSPPLSADNASLSQWPRPPAPVTEQGVAAFNSAAGTQQQIQSWISNQQSALDQLQAELNQQMSPQTSQHK